MLFFALYNVVYQQFMGEVLSSFFRMAQNYQNRLIFPVIFKKIKRCSFKHGVYYCGLVALYYYAALLPRRRPHIASHSVRPSVCPSVRPSRYRSLPSVTSRHPANYNDTHVRAAYRTAISAAQILVIIMFLPR